MMLKVENLDVFYGDAQALDGVSIEIEEGAIVAIVGANGAGKTSLIRAIAGIHKPARGTVTFEGRDIAGLPSHKICDLGIGQVAEGRQIFPTMSVIENLEIVDARAEQLTGLFEADTMFSSIRKIFGMVPLDRHGKSVSN